MKMWIMMMLFLFMLCSTAMASPFDGMTVAEIRAHDDFKADTQSMSWATNSGDPDAPHIYWWIGYIPNGDQRIYFTSYGEALTCVQWDATGEWVPLWVRDALDRLLMEDIIVLDPDSAE